MLNRIRKWGFWTKDALTGGSFKKHYDEIKHLQENARSPEAVAQKANYLEQLLSHAVQTTPFYAPFKCDKQHLSWFPVLNKQLVRDNMDSFLSETYKGRELKVVTTSGSTGYPFSVYKDPTKLLRHAAENIYFFEDVGHKVGDRLYYLRVWNKINKKSTLTAWMENLIMIETGNLCDEQVHRLINRLSKDRTPKVLLGFASSFEQISSKLGDIGDGLHHIQGIVTISEALSDQAREILKGFFHCPVVSRYSNMENGFVANQLTGSEGDYVVNESGYFVELLKMEEDKPAEQGEKGRIVVTDLFNYAMPLIRYDTGDIGVYKEKNDNGISLLSAIEGRKTDMIYNTKGEMLSPHTITNTMWAYNRDVLQFQFIQDTQREYTLRLNMRNHIDIERELQRDLRRYLGEDAEIIIDYVSEIPQLNSGKRRKIINNWQA